MQEIPTRPLRASNEVSSYYRGATCRKGPIYVLKSEAQNPKLETNPKLEGSKRCRRLGRVSNFEFQPFVLASDFEIRVSDLAVISFISCPGGR
jgi:hypothetical protein